MQTNLFRVPLWAAEFKSILPVHIETKLIHIEGNTLKGDPRQCHIANEGRHNNSKSLMKKHVEEKEQKQNLSSASLSKLEPYQSSEALRSN